jgi:stearoyl-CoA desaturase (delta-9 desaturase)
MFMEVDPTWYVVWGMMHFFIITFGVHFTFHRLIAHQTFQTNKWIERFGTLVGCLSVTGSSIGWSVVHIQHHIHSDTDKDPHSPKIMGWKIILGFLNYNVLDKRSLVPLKHVIYNPFHIFIEKYYPLILITWWALCYITFGLNGLLFLGLLPSCTSGVAMMASNYLLHNKQGQSSNNPLMWFLVFGETAHSDHHIKPYSPYVAAYEWIDPTNYYIKLLRTDK